MKTPLVKNYVNRMISNTCYPLLCVRIDRMAFARFLCKISNIRHATKFGLDDYCADIVCRLKELVSNYQISSIA